MPVERFIQTSYGLQVDESNSCGRACHGVAKFLTPCPLMVNTQKNMVQKDTLTSVFVAALFKSQDMEAT